MSQPPDQPYLFSLQSSGDAELSAVAMHLKAADPTGTRIAHTLRRTYDMLLDGQHTGRYRWDQLYKTEKTHFGTLLEINLQREFRFDNGQEMDFAICGTDVDCKFSQNLGEWMIPPEALDHLLLGFWASDDHGLWSAGLVRAATELLTSENGNRDKKRRLTRAGRQHVTWLFENQKLPENALLRIPAEQVLEIFECSKHGTKRIDMLFRLAQQRLISRTVVATVAQQDDYMRRVRGNGGSRSSLRPEGIVILGQYASHVAVATALGLPSPGPGESVSVRLARQRANHSHMPSVVLDGEAWVVAGVEDPVELAPGLPAI